jgi:hypothetical protein
MLDCETLGVSKSPIIASIGAVKFDADNIVDRFHVGINPEDCERYGLTISASTFLWWLDPKREQARKQLLELPKIDLFAALDGFAMWVQQTPTEDRGSCWGKGSTFDNVIVKSAYDAVKLDYPFSYRQDECYRTLANRRKDIEYVQIGTAHDAVADAESQAVHLQEICRACGIVL